jgi:putative peptide zinc metalloprotease protein
MDSLNIIPKLHVRTRWSKQNAGDYFLFNDEFDSQMTISESALLVIECINGKNTIKEITDKLTENNSNEDDYRNITTFICQDLKNNYILDDNDIIKNKKKQKFNKIIFKEELITPISDSLTFLFNKNIVASLYLLLIGSATYSIFTKYIPTEYISNWYILGIGAFFLILLHELGHCAALAFCGLKSKGIGIGIHFVFPMVFAEVTQAWVLSPRKRIIVDLGGFHFQLILTLLYFIIAIQSDDSTFMDLVRFSIFLFFFNLNPFIKSDVYWALSDYLNIPNLHDMARDRVYIFFKEPKFSNVNLLFIFGIIRYIFLILILIFMVFYIYKSTHSLSTGNYIYSFNNIKTDIIMIISLGFFLFAMILKYKR